MNGLIRVVFLTFSGCEIGISRMDTAGGTSSVSSVCVCRARVAHGQAGGLFMGGNVRARLEAGVPRGAVETEFAPPGICVCGVSLSCPP